ncbi:MAG: hypothetical protein KDA25_06160 [Phycisphaerales bacterium]|nr:hypothetical protein [Phycisphaerales bacterium]
MKRLMGFGAALLGALAIGLSGAPAYGVADVLILDSSVTGGATSLEAQAAIGLGYTVDIVSDATWSSMTAAQFSAYRCIIIGDPTCGFLSPVIAGNACTWNAAVDGNVVIIGTDPTFHAVQGGQQLIDSAIAFAAANPGETGAYICLSCAYGGALPGTPVPELAGFCSPCNPSCFTITGQLGCYNNAHIVAVSPALTGLTDADLSNWSCSVHEAFDGWPSDFIPLAIAEVAGGPFTAGDGTVGFPYIMARGDIEPIGGCAEITDEHVSCDLDGSGSVTTTFSLTNFSGVDVSYLLVLPPAGVTVTPNVIALAPPLADGGTTGVSLTFSGASPGDEICFTLGMNTASFTECCSLEHCFTVPNCDCAFVHEVTTECIGDGTNDFSLSFNLDNLSGDTVYHSFFIPVSPASGITFTPNVVHYTPPLLNLGTAPVSTVISGGTPGEEICFLFTLHNANLDVCCAIEICITVPECTGCLDCPAGALIEDEPCGTNTNGGCDFLPPAFTHMHCGDLACGTVWSDATGRDRDWYELELDDADGDGVATIRATLTSEFTGLVTIVGGIDTCKTVILAEGVSEACGEPTSISVCVEVPGSYAVVVEPLSPVSCSELNDYTLLVECTDDCGLPACCPCPADLNGDGFVDAADLASLLANWGRCAACVQDFDKDGVVGPSDLATLLAAWGPCP